MKLKLTLIALLFFSIQASAQTKNNLSVYWGTVSDNMNIHGAIGDFGYLGNGGSKFGLNYERLFGQYVSIQTGLQYTDDKLTLQSILPMTTNRAEEIKLITIPVIGKLTFWKIVFVDAGFLVDFESGEPLNTTTNNQSGIGFETGAGLQYHFGGLQFFVNPYWQEHDASGFKKSNQNFNLNDHGWKFGLGYNF